MVGSVVVILLSFVPDLRRLVSQEFAQSAQMPVLTRACAYNNTL
jgi:hypothetical protein